MVKIPSMDELKKMGSGLIDQAKAVKFGEIVDKVKSGIDSVSGKKAPTAAISDEELKALFQDMFATVNELAELQRVQVNVLKKVEVQLEQLAHVVETYQKPEVVVTPPPEVKPEIKSEIKNEEEKPHE